MALSTFHLARTLRPRTFDQVVGQELVIRMLKNSLYKSLYFPVYLLAGQRGCGKTTLGRIFAAAVNCANLEQFRKDPKATPLPCLTCQSCVLMGRQEHPDFIEIDAASHTGVDNVRALIEACSLLPIVGHKRIYLIDEVHMLSKAAFNALLKVLEEPPMHALFLLATTDLHKVLDTVRSRSFQLFFDPVPRVQLTAYLAKVCQDHGIAHDLQGLDLLYDESEGSVRDALNSIERLRCANVDATKASVARVLSLLDVHALETLFEALVANDLHAVCAFAAECESQGYAPLHVWKRCVEFVHLMVYVMHDVAYIHTTGMPVTPALKILATKIGFKKAVACLELLYQHEQQYVKSTHQHALVLFTLTALQNILATPQASVTASPRQGVTLGAEAEVTALPVTELPVPELHVTELEKKNEQPSAVTAGAGKTAFAAQLQAAVHELKGHAHQVVATLFSQAVILKSDEQAGAFVVGFPTHCNFFDDVVRESQDQWQAVFEKHTGRSPLVATWSFSVVVSQPAERTIRKEPMAESAVTQSVVKSVAVKPAYSVPGRPAAMQAKTSNAYAVGKRFAGQEQKRQTKPEKIIDVSDATVWPITQLIVSQIPSKVVLYDESNYV